MFSNSEGAIFKEDNTTLTYDRVFKSSVQLINDNPYLLPNIKLEYDIQHYTNIDCFQSNKKGEQHLAISNTAISNIHVIIF